MTPPGRSPAAARFSTSPNAGTPSAGSIPRFASASAFTRAKCSAAWWGTRTARIEQATKAVECDCLVSLDAVMAAGEEDLWTEVPCPPLPGVTRKIVLMGLKAGGS